MYTRKMKKIHFVLPALLSIAVLLSSCAGGAGGGSETASNGSAIGVSLSITGNGQSRQARSVYPDGSLSVRLTTDSGYDVTSTTTVSNSTATLTFTEVPIDDYAVARATLTAGDGSGTIYTGTSERTLVQAEGTVISVALSQTLAAPVFSITAGTGAVAVSGETNTFYVEDTTSTFTLSITNYSSAPSVIYQGSWGSCTSMVSASGITKTLNQLGVTDLSDDGTQIAIRYTAAAPACTDSEAGTATLTVKRLLHETSEAVVGDVILTNEKVVAYDKVSYAIALDMTARDVVVDTNLAMHISTYGTKTVHKANMTAAIASDITQLRNDLSGYSVTTDEQLTTIYNNRNTIKAALSAIGTANGANELFSVDVQEYSSSTLDPTRTDAEDCYYYLNFLNGGHVASPASWNKRYVLGVRSF